MTGHFRTSKFMLQAAQDEHANYARAKKFWATLSPADRQALLSIRCTDLDDRAAEISKMSDAQLRGMVLTRPCWSCIQFLHSRHITYLHRSGIAVQQLSLLMHVERLRAQAIDGMHILGTFCPYATSCVY